MKKKVTTEVVVSDLTKEEISSGGWELVGLNSGRTYHFKSISEIVVAFLDQPEVFGLSGAFTENFLDLARTSR